ncbi:hypothetical protein OZZ18_07715 [[Ruminococcus] gnavus]|jgi:hypothetical protein|uniref:hypothetical protein n=2 Tax=Bacillota TaxID=1239 RepID=UPI0007EB734C|nr:hypothetical protein [Mediterraneibacter gnavus]MCZ0646790.1 hypothetical protein [Mediterraneibacter gnavus]
MKYLSWTGLQHFYSKYIGNLNEQLKNVKKSIGNLGNLATTSKENLVYAINEIKSALSSFVEKKDIVDNLTSQAGDAPLSANMGRELSEDMSVETEWKIYQENGWTLKYRKSGYKRYQVLVAKTESKSQGIRDSLIIARCPFTPNINQRLPMIMSVAQAPVGYGNVQFLENGAITLSASEYANQVTFECYGEVIVR